MLAGPEKGTLDDASRAFHRGEFERLRSELDAAYAASRLPERPTAGPALNDLLLRLRRRDL